MCLWCDLSTHLGDQDWGAGTSRGHFLRRYWGFFFLSLVLCVVTVILIYWILKMKLLSNILAPVCCVTVAGGTLLLKRNFSIFLLQKNRKKKKTAGSDDRETGKWSVPLHPVSRRKIGALQPWKTWLLQIMGTIYRTMWTWYTIGSTQTTFRVTLSYGQLCRVFLWVFQSTDPRNCCLFRKSFPFCEICSHHKLEWDV